MDDRFRFEDPRDSKNEIMAYIEDDGRLTISVAEEQAVDSYNSTFNCSVTLDRAAAKRLRDYLNAKYPA